GGAAAGAGGGEVVVRGAEAERAGRGQGGAAAEAVAAGVVPAARARHAGPLVAPSFRPPRAARRAAAPRRWTASRASGSALPSDSGLALEASRAARRPASPRD